MSEEEQRPVHHVYNVETGETESVPVSEEEWSQIKKSETESAVQYEQEAAENEALAEAVRNHDDPVVKALGRKLGLI